MPEIGCASVKAVERASEASASKGRPRGIWWYAVFVSGPVDFLVFSVF